MKDSRLNGIQKSLTRLANSNTYLKRKNARREFLTNIKELVQMVDSIYPKLRKDGTMIRSVSRRGYSCPYCRAPLRNAKMLVRHLYHKHGWRHSFFPREGTLLARCLCGWEGKSLGRHLASQDDLVVHLGAATLRNAGITTNGDPTP